MGENTNISWTDHSWNPWTGCTKVSPGCAHCYMFRDKLRYGQDPTTVVRSKPPTFNKPLHWAEPAMIFTCSWSDFFHEEADPWRDEAWDIIRNTPQHTYQILTKRPERMPAFLPDDWGSGWPNVWLGTSVEYQRWGNARVHQLLTTRAAKHFLSCEPLLGPVDLTRLEWGTWTTNALNGRYYQSGDPPVGTGAKIDWVIAGGESGPRARPCELDWLRSLRDQCAETGTAYFLKQIGGYPNKRADELAVLDGQRHTEWPT